MKSQVVTVTETSAGVKSAATKDATALDVVSTVLSTNSALTGVMGLAQRAGLVVAGMSVQSKLKNDTFNFLKA